MRKRQVMVKMEGFQSLAFCVTVASVSGLVMTWQVGFYEHGENTEASHRDISLPSIFRKD